MARLYRLAACAMTATIRIERTRAGERLCCCSAPVDALGFVPLLVPPCQPAPLIPCLTSLPCPLTVTLLHTQVRLWQALCVLCPVVPAQQLPSALETILTALQDTNAASVKQYQETIAVQLIRREPALFQSMVMPVLHDYSSQ